MRFFVNHETCDNEIFSYDDLRKEFAKLIVSEADEYDGVSFSEFLNNCMDYNNGSLTEIPERPRFETEVARCFFLRLEREKGEHEIRYLAGLTEDEFYSEIDYDDYTLLEDQIALKLYKIRKGITE